MPGMIEGPAPFVPQSPGACGRACPYGSATRLRGQPCRPAKFAMVECEQPCFSANSRKESRPADPVPVSVPLRSRNFRLLTLYPFSTAA